MAGPFDDPYAQPRSMADGLGQGMQGMFSGLKRGFQGGANALNPYSNRLLAFGAGMLDSGPSGAAKGLIVGSALDRESADRRKLNEALAALGSEDSGLLPESPALRSMMAADPEFAKDVLTQRLKPADYGDKYQGYLLAKNEGYEGSWMDYQKEFKGDGGVTIDLGYKLPTGYRPVDPNNPDAGVEPIPGGPAEELPAELAARIGLADSFIGEVPTLRKSIIGGEVTGPYDRAQAGWNDASTQAAVQRKILSGIDAMKRMLSGAGLPVAEQAEYERRYLPSYTDDATSAASKLDQLAAELAKVKETVMRGRGGTSATDDDPLGLGGG